MFSRDWSVARRLNYFINDVRETRKFFSILQLIILDDTKYDTYSCINYKNFWLFTFRSPQNYQPRLMNNDCFMYEESSVQAKDEGTLLLKQSFTFSRQCKFT